MSRHIPPHRFADADAGTLTTRERAVIDSHVRECSRCADARTRVRDAREAMLAMAEDEPEDMRWDHIGAQIYWKTAADRRVHTGAGRRSWILAAAAVATAAAGAAGYALLRDQPAADDTRAVAPAPAPEPAPAPAPLPAAEPMLGVVTVASGDIALDGAPLEFDALIETGHTLATSAGARVTVQFDADSALTLGPDSTLSFAAFDTGSIRLDVTGTVAVRLERRAPEQQFAIVAGSREVVVRGTVFRVGHRADRLEVACTRGRVAVLEGDAVTEVAAGEHLSVFDALARAGVARPIAPEQLAALDESLRAPVLPTWSGARDALAASSRIDVQAIAGNAVEIDGIGIGIGFGGGAGGVAVRVAPGRHHVELGAEHGQWIEVGAGAVHPVVARVERKRPARSVRAPQLDAQLDKRVGRLAQCGRTLAAHGIARGSYVKLEVGVNADGSQGYLNIRDYNVPSEVAECVRDVVDEIDFPRGPAERIVKTISLAR
jgi:hypothetical protein